MIWLIVFLALLGSVLLLTIANVIVTKIKNKKKSRTIPEK